MYCYDASGCKVKITEESAKKGNAWDEKEIKKYLEIEKEYTVDHTWLSSKNNFVYLKEVPGISFNAKIFVDAE